VFVDDQIENVHAADEFGWTAIHFTGTADAIRRTDAALGAQREMAGRDGESGLL
jgi:FMN phosphatase YigB (HAD superfamily)